LLASCAADWEFLLKFKEIGLAAGASWLTEHFDAFGPPFYDRGLIYLWCLDA
jgi:hypothetical protein